MCDSNEASGKDAMPFTDDWNAVRTLGEGSFGEVKLLMHRKGGDCIAVKIMRFQDRLEHMAAAKREATMLKALKHPNIIKAVGSRTDRTTLYLFLEYASCGELYDRIEPDKGMPENEARHFYSQLISGVDYLHSMGIAHRDLKPENLLIADNEVLKICDFGMATVFRNRCGVERLLETRCGTPPYLAPEVLKGPYRAQPVDLWSSGIVLVAMLTGELPWNSATDECQTFSKWNSSTARWNTSFWKRLGKRPLSLIKQIIVYDPAQRATIETIKNHEWLKSSKEDNAVDAKVRKFSWDTESTKLVLMSQPEHYKRKEEAQDGSIKRGTVHSFSQPTNMDHLLLASQADVSHPSLVVSVCTNATLCSLNFQNSLEKLVKRMTRLCLYVGLDESLRKVEELCVNLGMQPVICGNQVTVSTVDSRRNVLIFKVNGYEMNGTVLMDFRLSKGDGLEFKRIFPKIKLLLEKYSHPKPGDMRDYAQCRDSL